MPDSPSASVPSESNIPSLPAQLAELTQQLEDARAIIRRLLNSGSESHRQPVILGPLTTESEKKLHGMLRTSTVLVFTQDDRLRYTWFFNPRDPNVKGGMGFVGRTDDDLFSPENAHKITTLKRQVLQSGVGSRNDIVVRSPDGEWVYELALEPLKNAEGTVEGLSGSLLDVTERSLADRELRLLAQTVASTRDMVVLTDLSGTVLFVNDAFLQALGFTFDEAIGKDFSFASPLGKDKELRHEIREAALHDGWHGESVGLCKDGSTVPVDVWISQVENDSGKPVAMVAVARDITDAKKAQRIQTAIYRIAGAVNTTKDLQELYRAIHEIVGELMHAENLYIAVKSETTGLLSFPYFVDEVDPQPPPRLPHKGLTEYVIRTGKPLLASPDVFNDLLSRGEVENLGTPSLDWLGVPLIAGGKTLGALVVQTYAGGTRFRDEDLRILTFVSTQVALAIDRKTAEESLQESEHRYRSLFEDAGISLWEEDASALKLELDRLRQAGVRDFRSYLLDRPDEAIRCMRLIKCLDVNRATVALYGARDKDEIRSRMGEIFLPEGIPQFSAIIASIAEANLLTAIEAVNRTFDGRLLHVAIHFSIVPGHENDLSKIIVSIADITTLKNAEEALRESEARLQTVFESLPFDLWVCDVNGRYLMQNPVSIAHWGDHIGKHPRDTGLDPAIVKVWEENNGRAIAGELVTGEHHYEHDGKTIHVYNIITPVKRDGAVLGIMGLNVDISERKELQQQLLQAQKLESIGTLAGGIAHDFNNILSIIMGHASLLTEVAGNPAKLSRSAAAIQKAAKRGAALVRQILTFARKADATFEPVNINEIATELGKMLEETFPRTMNIVLDLAADLPSIDADRTQMHQTLLNLCVNARDAMPQGGVLTISSRLAFPHEIAGKAYPSFICVTVADDGSGMDEATQRRIFEPFFTTKESGKGTGLGLAVVYGIMESHHGFITVDSVSGRGTAFHLFFPVPATHIVEQQAAVTMEGKTQGGTETLLVVEDEEMLCELLRNILEAAGYTVLSASDGEQAVSMYESLADDIALVITDIGLPRMSGHEVFRRLRAMRPQARVIIATGYIEPDAKSNLLALGAKHILQKPYLPEEVLRSVRDALTSKG